MRSLRQVWREEPWKVAKWGVLIALAAFLVFAVLTS